MKKLAVLLLIAAMSFNVVACGNNDKSNSESSSVQESTQETGAEESSEVVESTEESSAEESAPVEENTGMSEEMSALRQAVADALGDNYFPQMAMPAEYLEGLGLTADLYEEAYGEMPMISTNVDTLILVKPAEGQLEAVETALNAYREGLINDTMQYPMNVGKIQASEVKVIGDYVCFVQLGGDVMEAAESGDEAVIKQCQEHNAMAIEAMEAVIAQ